jgi:hypothetical protein
MNDSNEPVLFIAFGIRSVAILSAFSTTGRALHVDASATGVDFDHIEYILASTL